MKKTSLGLFAAIAAVAILGGHSALHAMDKDKDGKGPGGERMGRMKEDLDLSDAQAAKFKEAMQANREALKALMDKAKLDTDSLRVLVDKKAADNVLSAAIEAVKADRDALQAQMEKNHQRLRAFLSPLQQAKLVISMVDRMKGGMGGPEGGPHGDHGDHDGDKDGGPEHGPDSK